MKINEALQKGLADHCEKLAKMFGVTGEDYILQATHLHTFEELKEWLKPIVMIVQSQYQLRLALRSHENMAHPEELEAFSVVVFNKDMLEMFRLEVTAQGMGLICPGLLLLQDDEAATRYDPVALLQHIINRQVPADLLQNALAGLGKPKGLRAEEVWRLALVLLDEAVAETSPRKKVFDDNMSNFNAFIKTAFGSEGKVVANTAYGQETRYASNGQPRPVLNSACYTDDLVLIEITLADGLLAVFNFASLTPEACSFSPGKMARTVARSDDPVTTIARLENLLLALQVLTAPYPDAEKTRRHVLLTLRITFRQGREASKRCAS